MTTFTAKFLTDSDYAEMEFEAETPEQALAQAKAFYDNHGRDLDFVHYDGCMPVNQIEIFDPDGGEVALWRDADQQLCLAAPDLRDALEAMTAAAQRVIGNWSQGDLAAAVNGLECTIAEAKAALAKAGQERSSGRARNSADDVLHILKKILAAHDTRNNGAIMGEAVLCPMFANMARAAIAKAEGEQS